MSQPLKELNVEALVPPMNVTLVTNEEDLTLLQKFLETEKVIGLDTETNMTNTFYDRRIRTIQIGNKEAQFIIDMLPWAKQIEQSTPEKTLMFGTGNYTYLPIFQPIIDVIKPVLESSDWVKVGHNLEFDYAMLKWCFGIRMRQIFCTYLAERVLFAGYDHFKQQNRWNLKGCIAKYFHMAISKEEQCGFDLSSELTPNQILYAALDCRLVLGLREKQRQLLKSADLGFTANIEFGASPAFGDMHLNGFFLNKDAWLQLVNEVETDYKATLEKLDDYFIPVVGKKLVPQYDLTKLEQDWKTTPTKTKEAQALRKERRAAFQAAQREVKAAIQNFQECQGEANINYSSPEQLLLVLRKMGYKLRSTNDRELKHAGGKLIDLIRDFRSLLKLRTSYGTGFIENIHPQTGRVHSRFMQIGAETGRPTSANPNIFNVVSGKDWRGCFQAPPGKKLITIDCAGQELRIMADMSQDPIMLDAFLKNWDVHSVGAEIIFGDQWKEAAEENCAYYTNHQKCSCKNHKVLRNLIKSINFGIAYGMEADKLADSIGTTKKEAQELLDKHKATFPKLNEFLEKLASIALNTGEARTLAKRRRGFNLPSFEKAREYVIEDCVAQLTNKKTVNLEKTDTKILLKATELADQNKVLKKFYLLRCAIGREGKNSPVQGGGTDIMKLAMGYHTNVNTGFQFMWNKLEPEFGAKLVNFVYDEFVVEVDEDKAEIVSQYLADCIKEAGSLIVKSIPMESEWNIDTKWKK